MYDSCSFGAVLAPALLILLILELLLEVLLEILLEVLERANTAGIRYLGQHRGRWMGQWVVLCCCVLGASLWDG